jgi:hypothetical protein
MPTNPLQTIIKDVLDHLEPKVKFGNWDGSYDSHPNSVTNVVPATGTAKFAGLHFQTEFQFTVSAGWPTTGPHVIKGDLTLPNGPSTINFDGADVPGASIVLLPNNRGLQPRAEVVLKWATPGDPNNHYRFDADLSLG